jgi:uncharacterized protein YnzC (UPF0291/DUF896 family)
MAATDPWIINENFIDMIKNAKQPKELRIKMVDEDGNDTSPNDDNYGT